MRHLQKVDHSTGTGNFQTISIDRTQLNVIERYFQSNVQILGNSIGSIEIRLPSIEILRSLALDLDLGSISYVRLFI